MDWKNKVVLITGGTGSFGKAFTEHCLRRLKPRKLIIFSRDEMKQYEMQKTFDHPSLRYFIGDVRDPDRLHRAFQGVDYVIHAAALKIVPTAEYNPFEFVKTNILGAENVINLAIDNKVERVIALSTDKACNPINLYGATKLCAEKMFSAANNYSPEGTRFGVVRYGNVFGSRGSVVPFFRECRSRGVVPVTDENMTRFWITLDQGVRFVVRCLDEMQGGEIFVPKIPSIRITDLAKAICPKAKVKIIGRRPGEKLYETLVSPDEGLYTYEFDDCYISYPETVPASAKIHQNSLGASFAGYMSHTNKEWLTMAELKKMLREAI